MILRYVEHLPPPKFEGNFRPFQPGNLHSDHWFLELLLQWQHLLKSLEARRSGPNVLRSSQVEPSPVFGNVSKQKTSQRVFGMIWSWKMALAYKCLKVPFSGIIWTVLYVAIHKNQRVISVSRQILVVVPQSFRFLPLEVLHRPPPCSQYLPWWVTFVDL